MRKLNLTLTQRFGLENMLGQLKGKRDAMAPIIAVLAKIEVSEALRAEVVRDVPGGQIIDKRAIDAAPLLTVELTAEESRRVRKALEEWEPEASAWKWALPILEQLEQPYVEA